MQFSLQIYVINILYNMQSKMFTKNIYFDHKIIENT